MLIVYFFCLLWIWFICEPILTLELDLMVNLKSTIHVVILAMWLVISLHRLVKFKIMLLGIMLLVSLLQLVSILVGLYSHLLFVWLRVNQYTVALFSYLFQYLYLYIQIYCLMIYSYYYILLH